MSDYNCGLSAGPLSLIPHSVEEEIDEPNDVRSSHDPRMSPPHHETREQSLVEPDCDSHPDQSETTMLYL